MHTRTIDHHRAAVLRLVNPSRPQLIPSTEALGLVVADDAAARLPIPAFDNSAMDGFAVHAQDITGPGPWTFPVVADVPAGHVAPEFPRGSAVRIMTGAGIGHEGLRVIPVELSDCPAGPQVLPDSVTISSNAITISKSHIRRQGENVHVGGTVAQAGTVIDAGSIAALISAGVVEVLAVPLPRVGIISTGAELAQPGDAPAVGLIPNSNGPMLTALALSYGADPTALVHRHVEDTPQAVRAALDELSGTCDIIVSTGGVSAGAYDCLREVVEPTDESWFGEVSQRPGAPQGLALWNGTALLCLPGNPVAAFVSFHLYAGPAIQKLRGIVQPKPRSLVALAGADFPPRRGGVTVIPVRLHQQPHGEYTATAFNHAASSHAVGSLSGTHGYVVTEEDIRAGQRLSVFTYPGF